MKRTLILTTLGALTFAGCAAGTGGGHPLPQAQAQAAHVEAPAPAPRALVTTTTAVEVEKISSCDIVREALLTGGPADIERAMAALQADTTADATAREYADNYLHRDVDTASLRSMDVSLVRMACAG